MPIYTVTVDLTHEWTSGEEYTATVEADSPDEAMALAEEEARCHCARDSWDVEHSHTYAESSEITKVEAAEGEELPDFTPRCDRTPDMFSGARA